MTETLGKHLVSCRLKQGMTIEEIAAITCINQRLIRAAEADRFEELPGPVFVKGMLRAYAKVVRVDGQGLVDRYSELGLVGKDKSPKMINMPLQPNNTRSSLIMLVAVISIAILYFAGYYLGVPGLIKSMVAVKTAAVETIDPKGMSSHQADMDEKRGRAVVDKTSAAPVPANETGRSIRLPDVKEGKTGDTTTTRAVETVNIEAGAAAQTQEPAQTAQLDDVGAQINRISDTSLPLNLKITAESDSWIKVLIDGEITREIILREGNTVTWWAQKGYKVSIGNVAGTKLYLNGETVAIPQPASNVLTNLILPSSATEETQMETSR